MNTEALNRWLTLGANVGVIAGIVFLGVEIQQSTTVTRSVAEQEISNTMVDHFMRIAENPDLARVVMVAHADPGALSDVEIVQYQYVTGSAFLLLEGAYKQFQLGFLPEASWKPSEKVIKDLLSNPVSRNWWVNGSTVFSPDFETMVIAVSGLERETN